MIGLPGHESHGRSGGFAIAASLTRRDWLPDAGVGALVLFIGLFETVTTSYYGQAQLAYLFITIAVAVAAAMSRRAPGAALALVWAVCAIQLLTGSAVLYVQAAIGIVAFGTARWGRPVTVVLGGLSIPASALVGVLGVLQGSRLLRGFVTNAGYDDLVRAAYQFSSDWKVGAIIIGMALLGVPWLAGLALRFRSRARQSDASQRVAEEAAVRAHLEYEQANEIARLREQQARTARDVHDVVGHSLAVILAQAESGQYLPDDNDLLRTTMRTIATTARTSLQDVRQVLAETQGPVAPRPGGLESLIDGVRASGHEIVSAEVGTPQPLPPEMEVVAFRVLQEMLTNAIKHGRRDRPVLVERHWPQGSWDDGDLRIEVRNVEETLALPVGGSIADADPGGRGFEGMRRRLDSVGGRIDVRRRDEPDGATFTTTAWVPVRA